MSLWSNAQELVVVDPSFSGAASPALSPMAPHAHQHSHNHMNGQGHSHQFDLEPEEVVLESDDGDQLVINNPEHVDIIVLEDIPGAGDGLPEIVLEEVSDEVEEKKEKDVKENKWDWEAKGAPGFIEWIKERVGGVPRHSGMDTAGLERAMSYLQRLDSEISKAMRLDLDGALNANKIEEVRAQIDEGLSRLEDRLEKIKKSKKKKKSTAEIYHTGFVKEAQKITGIQGVYVTVPLLISRIARVCINGMVSAGHDIEDTYDKQVKMYKLSMREQAEVRQLIEDMGYAFRQDRGYTPEDALEVSDSNGIDWMQNFKG